MAIGDDNVIWGPPEVTTSEAEANVLRAGEVVYESGVHRLRLGDGVTLGGIIVGSDGGGGGGGGTGLAFKTISVVGADPGSTINADQVDDTLTLNPLRGLVIQPNASGDRLDIGFPHGGAIGNGWFFTGETWVPSEVILPPLDPQEGFASTDLVVESQTRKYFDGCHELTTFLPTANPASVVYYNGVPYPVCVNSALMYIDGTVTISDVSFESVYIKLRFRSSATGTARLVVKYSKIVDPTDALAFGDDNIVDTQVQSTDQTDILIGLPEEHGLSSGDTVFIRFGRDATHTNDTVNGDIIFMNSWLKTE